MGTPPGAGRKCVACGRDIAMDANVCQYCGHDYRAQPAAAPKEKSWLPVVGGVLILIGGILEIIAGASLIWSGGVLEGLMPVDVEGFEAVQDFLTMCGAIFVILGLIGVLGGIFAILRKSFALAILGGIFALPGWFLPALIGIILVAISKKDFE
jgi:hypothetical protein